MRARTKITAWVFIIWGMVGVVSMQTSVEPSKPGEAFLTACALAAVAMWACVLMSIRWARKVLLLLLVVQFFGALYSDTGYSAAHGPHAVDFWTGAVLLAAAFNGWQAFVLLTENPANWRVSPRPNEEKI